MSGIEFASLISHFMRSGGDLVQAAQNAAVNRQTPKTVAACLKSAVDVGTLTDSDFARPLEGYSQIIAAFLESLVNRSFFDTALVNGAFRRLPIGQSIAIISSGAAASIVGEGAVKNFTKIGTSGALLLQERKAVGLLAMTEELLRNAAAGSLDIITRELQTAVGKATDLEFFNVMLDGSGAFSTTSAGTSANTAADVGTILSNLNTSATSQIYFAADSTVCKKLSVRVTTAGEQAFPGVTAQGGELLGYPLICTDAVPSGYLVGMDCD